MLNTQVTARHIDLNDGTETEVPTRFDYTSFDPFAIHLQFNTGPGRYVDWEFARDLLVVGMASESWVGQGDVRLCRVEDSVALLLESPSGRALFFFSLYEVSEFVGRTLIEMPLGDEKVANEHPLADLAA